MRIDLLIKTAISLPNKPPIALTRLLADVVSNHPVTSSQDRADQ
ncbi:hypothetical protein FHS82_004114 [Pseudochelatococcus lubricantis]|uniref:Uncharacterized protein n=1 Tax=Pseudochelatococcus lubricantis TaxID=1538102 RepID=A0ABX0V4U7_9HYPH|nr:hypothetical protein [Pseudochelatococcus lubricantis]NIJ60244.1 hypothetical protein [Pseudochelatococcus lubricantis]